MHARSKIWYGIVSYSVSHGYKTECFTPLTYRILFYISVHIERLWLQRQQWAFKNDVEKYSVTHFSSNFSEIVKITNWTNVYFNHKSIVVEFHRITLTPLIFGYCFQNKMLDILKHQVFLTNNIYIYKEEYCLIDACTSIHDIYYKRMFLKNGDYGDYGDYGEYDENDTKEIYRYVKKNEILAEQEDGSTIDMKTKEYF